MDTGRYLSAGQFRDEIADDLGIDDPNLLRLMIRWIWNFQFQSNADVAFTQRDLALPLQYEKIIPYADKPCDFVWLISAVVGDKHGKCTFIPYYEPVYPQIQSMERGCCNRTQTSFRSPYLIQEQNERFDFSQNLPDNYFLYLRYRTFNLDPDTGFPVCDRTWLEPTKLWIKTCLASRDNTNGLVSVAELEAYYRLTGKLSRLAKSNERKYKLTDDAVDQIMAKFADPLYTPNNAELKKRLNQNAAYENRNWGSPGFGSSPIPDKW